MLSLSTQQKKINEAAAVDMISHGSVILSMVCGRFQNMIGIWSVAKDKEEAVKQWEEAYRDKYKDDDGKRLDMWTWQGDSWKPWKPEDDEPDVDWKNL